jgi:hypothetical protein
MAQQYLHSFKGLQNANNAWNYNKTWWK